MNMINKKRTLYFLFFICLTVILAAIWKSFTVSPVSVIRPKGETLVLRTEGDTAAVLSEDEASKVFLYTLPEAAVENLTLAIESYPCSIRVFLDGKEICSYEDPYMEKGLNIKWIALPENADERELSVIFEAGYENAIAPEIRLGTGDSLFLHYLRQNAMQGLFGGLYIILGLALCLAPLWVHSRDHQGDRKSAACLGLFVLFTGLWTITDSRILQFLTGRTAVITLLSFLSFLFIPFFFLLFLQSILEVQNKGFSVLCSLQFVYAGFVSLCYIFRVATLYTTLPGMHLLLFASVAFILKVSVSEYRSRGGSTLKKILAGIVLLLLCVVLALLSFYFRVSDNDYSLSYNIGTLIFILCLISAYLDRTYRKIREAADMEAYKRIAYTDVMTGMQNRSAFISDAKKQIPGQNCACVVFDINGLKMTNDLYGHLAGDDLIIDSARCIMEALSDAGRCYRIGGDEFVVVLDDIREEQLLDRIERLNRLTEDANRNRTPGIQLACGFSFGKLSDTKSLLTLFEEADQRMYEKKKAMKQL